MLNFGLFVHTWIPWFSCLVYVDKWVCFCKIIWGLYMLILVGTVAKFQPCACVKVFLSFGSKGIMGKEEILILFSPSSLHSCHLHTHSHPTSSSVLHSPQPLLPPFLWRPLHFGGSLYTGEPRLDQGNSSSFSPPFIFVHVTLGPILEMLLGLNL